jgi:CHASE3 domain sensor protein
MQWFNRMKINSRLALGFAFMVVMLGLVLSSVNSLCK